MWGNQMTPHTARQQAVGTVGISLREKGTFSSFRHQSWHKGHSRIQQTSWYYSSVLTGCWSPLKLCAGLTNSFKAHLTVLAEEEEASNLNLSEFPANPLQRKPSHSQDSQTVGKLPDVQTRMCSPQRAQLAWPPGCAQHRAPATTPAHLEMRTNHDVCSSVMSSGVTGAFPGSHQTCALARHSHAKPPFVGKGDPAHPAATEPIPYGLSQAEPSHQLGTAGPSGCSHAPLGGKGQRAGGQPCPGHPWGQSTWGSALQREVGEQHLPQRTWLEPTAVAGIGGQGMTSTAAEQTSACFLCPSCGHRVPCALAAPLNNSAL